MIQLYDSAISGNCYKVRLLLAQLGIPYQRIPVDLHRGEAKTDEFRAQFPLGRVPVMKFSDGKVLAESNAMLWHFAEGTKLIPQDSFERAEVMQWLFWEQYSHEPYIAVLRAWIRYFGIPPGRTAEIADRRVKGDLALGTMNKHLSGRNYFVGNRYSVADIALFAYTHVADDGGFSLNRYPAVCEWIQRIKDEPGYVQISA